MWETIQWETLQKGLLLVDFEERLYCIVIVIASKKKTKNGAPTVHVIYNVNVIYNVAVQIVPESTDVIYNVRQMLFIT